MKNYALAKSINNTQTPQLPFAVSLRHTLCRRLRTILPISSSLRAWYLKTRVSKARGAHTSAAMEESAPHLPCCCDYYFNSNFSCSAAAGFISRRGT
jgi:hypothetical protein